jgi:hypothetical protein
MVILEADNLTHCATLTFKEPPVILAADNLLILPT